MDCQSLEEKDCHLDNIASSRLYASLSYLVFVCNNGGYATY